MAVDRWMSRLPFGHDGPEQPEPVVEHISAPGAAAIRLSWSSRYSAAGLARHVAHFPHYNWWNPQSGEYLIAEPWRHRSEIATVLEASARRSRGALIERLVAELTKSNVKLLLLSDAEWFNHGRFYRELGFAELEKIIYFQLNGLEHGPRIRHPLPELQFLPLNWSNLAAAVRIDHAAFPWLWWNSEGEFTAYIGASGVQTWLALSAGRPVAYAGFTMQGAWGHLDRIAVDPAIQGSGFGAAMLAFSLGVMSRNGVSRVTLSTQNDNFTAHRVYEGFGFQKTNNSQGIVGRWLGVE